MRISRKQMQRMADEHRQKKRAALTASVADEIEGAKADPDHGRVLFSNSKGQSSELYLSDQGLTGIRTAEGREFGIQRNDSGSPTQIWQRNVAQFHIEYTSDEAIREIRQENQPLLHFQYGENPHTVEARFSDNATERFEYGDDPEQLVCAVDANGSVTRLERNDKGHATQLHDPRGYVTRFDAADSGEVEATHFPDGSKEEYFADNEFATIRRNGHTDTVLQFAGEDLAKVHFDDGETLQFNWVKGLPLKAVNSRHEVQFAYSEDDQLVLDDQDGIAVEIAINEDGNLSELAGPNCSFQYQYDGDDLATTIQAWDGNVFRFQYAESGRIEQIQFPNGVQTRIGVSPSGQVNSIASTSQSDGGFLTDSYQYDVRGRVRALTRNGTSLAYQYDPAGRLLSVQHQANLLERFVYDPSGNRIHANGRDAQFDEMNKLINLAGQACEHDDFGNLCQLGGQRFRHNQQGLLVEATNNGGSSVSFEYDALGRRVVKSIDNRATKYLWAGRQLLEEVTSIDDREVERREYLYYPGEYLPLGVKINGKIYCYHTDRLGTVLAMTDDQGKVVWKADYSAYGEAVVRIEEIAQPLRFLGQYHDAETGLHYNLFRYYHPQLGRYLTPDPIRYGGGSSNLYPFANNDPINQSDPDGHFVIPALAIIAGAALIGGLIGGAISAASGGSFWEGAAAGAVAGAIGAAAPIIGAALGASGAALVGVALLGDAIAGGVEACMTDGASLENFGKGAGISLLTTVATFGLAKIPGVRRALGAVGKKLGAVADAASNKMGSFAKRLRPRTLSKGKIQNYLKNAHKKSSQEVAADLQAAGLKVKGKSPDGRFMEFVDSAGNVRAKIHPPDKVTQYPHLHIYDKKGNALSAQLGKVSPKSADAHIQIGN